jgi:hypothetical protein
MHVVESTDWRVMLTAILGRPRILSVPCPDWMELAENPTLRESRRKALLLSMSDSAIYHQLMLGKRRLRSNKNGRVVSENPVFRQLPKSLLRDARLFVHLPGSYQNIGLTFPLPDMAFYADRSTNSILFAYG